MALVLIVLVGLCLTAGAAGASHKHHANLKQQRTDDNEPFKKVGCTSQHDRLRNDIIEKSKCGEPKEVFHEIKLQVSYLQVYPSAVWVKRCVGLCDFAAGGSKCVPTKTRKEAVPVRLYNSKTEKETCATIEVEVHESCRCCPSSSSECAAPRVFNPRKCSCQCPNMEERRTCLKKRNQNMRWNRSKCVCEVKRGPRGEVKPYFNAETP